jgi:formylglycine-generating enzyme required for sulfatase activity
MGQFPVTQGEYSALLGENPSRFTKKNGYSEDLKRPVESVWWADATNYCAQLTAKHTAMGTIPANTAYRLPTEAEWEYACRAWTSTRFYFGDDAGYTNLSSHAWYADNGAGMAHAVGGKKPNTWGLYDMSGNVWEWVQDAWAIQYPGGIVVDPQGPSTGLHGAVRGGSYSDPGSQCRSASRTFNGAKEESIGFRIVLAVSNQ